jgi:hypothetical protein
MDCFVIEGRITTTGDEEELLTLDGAWHMAHHYQQTVFFFSLQIVITVHILIRRYMKNVASYIDAISFFNFVSLRPETGTQPHTPLPSNPIFCMIENCKSKFLF